MTGLMTAKLNYRWLIYPLQKVPYTSLMLVFFLTAYLALQSHPVDPKTPLDFFGNLFRHHDLLHLALNLFVIAYAGSHCEAAKGGPFMLSVGIGSLLVGSAMEYLMIDGRFIGLSAGAYGLAAWWAIDRFGTTPLRSLLVTFFFVATIAAEFSDSAIIAHATGALTGGIFAMLGNFFKKKPPTPKTAQTDREQTGYTLRPMTSIDIPEAVKIIALTDEDDAEEAEQNLTNRHCQGMYVLEEAGLTIGMTGYYKSDNVEDIGWLSWTYLHPSAQGQGGGKYMMRELLRILDEDNIRKLFIATSDYCEDGVNIYASAHAFYESFGATKEVQIDDYHDSGEAMIIYGLGNPRYDSAKPQAQIQDMMLGVDFSGIHPAAESANGYEVQWESSTETRNITGLENCVTQAKQLKARILLLALPEDITNTVSTSLNEAGFVNCGMLQDYYEKDLGQVYWIIKGE
jgi:GNAT superfamily N-acetyltransferase